MGLRVCSTPGCPNLHDGAGRCPPCKAQAEQDRRPDGNPYRTPGHQRFREHVLARNPRCVCTGECGRHDGVCGAIATVADHHPLERRDLVAAGLDPNDPQRGRGVCKPCHDAKTARTSPGGWNNRT